MRILVNGVAAAFARVLSIFYSNIWKDLDKVKGRVCLINISGRIDNMLRETFKAEPYWLLKAKMPKENYYLKIHHNNRRANMENYMEKWNPLEIISMNAEENYRQLAISSTKQ